MTTRRASSLFLVVLLFSSVLVSIWSIAIVVPVHATTSDLKVTNLAFLPNSGPPGTWVTVTATLNKTLTTSPQSICSFSASSPNFFSPGASITCTVSGNAVIGSFKVRAPQEISASYQLPGLTYNVTIYVTGYNLDPTGTNSRGFVVKPPTIGLSASPAAAQPWPSSIIAMSTQTVYVHGWGFNASSTTCTYKATPGPFSSIATASSCSINAGEMSGQFTLIGGAGTTQTIVVSGTTTATENATASMSIVGGPAILLTPNKGAAGIRVDITGIGFSASDSASCAVSYKVTGGGALYTTTPTCTMTTVGSWKQPSATFTVAPTVTGGLTYYVNVTGSSGDSASAAFTPLSNPSITLNPTTGIAGQTINVTMYGPAYFSMLDVGLCTMSPTALFSSYNCFIANVTNNARLVLSSFVVSASAPGGVYAVTVTGSRGDYSAPAGFKVPARITLSPTSGSPPVVGLVAGTEVTVTGTGFTGPGSGCTIAATPTGLSIDTTGEPACTVSATGVLTAKFKVGIGSAFRIGGYSLNVTGPFLDSAVATFSVNATIALSPSSGSYGTLVNVLGSGFKSTAGTCSLTGTPAGSPGTCTQAADGTIVDRFTVNTTISGSYIITVTDAGGAPPSAFQIFQVGPGPSVTLTPSVGPTGTNFTIAGAGWNALDTSVKLRVVSGGDLWDLPANRTCTVSGGNIASGCAITVKLNARGGIHTINVTGTQLDSAIAQFLVQTTFTLAPSSGPTGTFVTMSGSGYLKNVTNTDCAALVSLGFILQTPQLFPTSGLNALKCKVENHVLSGNFTVALFTPAISYGAHLVIISNASYVQQGSVSATFTVYQPTITLSPTSGPRGASISVIGSNFNLNDTSCITVGTPSTAAIGVVGTSTCVFSAPGTISGSFAVNNTATVGSYTITVNGYNGATRLDNATASFIVEGSLSLAPASGRPGTVVLLFGSNFASGDTGCTISSSPSGLISNPSCIMAGGAMSGQFTVASGTSGPYTVIVTGTASGDVGRASFTVPQAPSLTLSPIAGPQGTAVTASGSNFAGTTCQMTSSPAGLFTTSSCSLSGGVLAPASSGFAVASGAIVGTSYIVTVTTNLGVGDSATAPFTVTAGPPGTLTLTPTSGPIGTVVTGSATGFTSDVSCQVTAAPSAILSSSSCTITGSGNAAVGFTVSSSASAGIYTILTIGNTGKAAMANFTVTTAGARTFTLTPNSGRVGTAITASGSNYAGSTCSLASSPSGLLSSQTCSILSGTLTGGFTVASGALAGGYTVTVTTNVPADTVSASFNVPSPTLTLSPSSGASGTTVTASGSNYAGTTCTLASLPTTLFTSQVCAISATGALSGGFTVASDAHSGSYTVTVTTSVPGETSSASFTVPSPTLAINPNSGAVGTAVSISGTNYVGNTCSISSSPSGLIASPTCLISSGILDGGFIVASGAVVGTYTVTVTPSIPGATTASAIFTVPSPTGVTLSLNPTSGTVGTSVSVSGSGYTGTTSCSLSSSPSGLFTSSSCSVSGGTLSGTFTVASGASSGSYTVTVTTNAETKSAAFAVTGWVPPKCVIATATFGSEASPAVQFLRNFRDTLVLSTTAGSAFMQVFNAWYYSFSPSVAQFIASNDPIRAPVRVLLYPLLGVLEVSAFTYSLFSGAPEFAVVMAGLVASSLIGLVYLTVPVLAGLSVLARRRKIRIASVARVSLTVVAVALALLMAGELAGSFLLLAVASSAIVLVCVIAVPTIAAFAILRPGRK